MSIKLDLDYEKHLRSAKPEHPSIKGSLSDIGYFRKETIPAINTDIRFDTLPQFKLINHAGLASLDHKSLPVNFNWRDNAGSKRSLIAEPGNQMLCGSCWAISAADIVADNHVVSGTVSWKPNLSTTWCLACYPQSQCQGGNPAKLYQDISENGIASKHCIDYSWCSENQECNGKATKHFDSGVLNLSKLIPSECGCYDSSHPHYLYFIDPPEAVALGYGGLTEENFANTIKKHIYYNGPVQGGFLVFKNFKSGSFTKVNGGVYLEKGNYDSSTLHFSEDEVDPSNYLGSHAARKTENAA